MGYKRHAPTPSPLRLLSICDARERGVPLPEIAKRTRHSISSIMRWSDKFNEELEHFQTLLRTNENLKDQLSFESFYPKRSFSVVPELDEEIPSVSAASGDE